MRTQSGYQQCCGCTCRIRVLSSYQPAVDDGGCGEIAAFDDASTERGKPLIEEERHRLLQTNGDFLLRGECRDPAVGDQRTAVGSGRADQPRRAVTHGRYRLAGGKDIADPAASAAEFGKSHIVPCPPGRNIAA